MAKVGNEVRLVLRLAEETVRAEKKRIFAKPKTTDFQLGFEAGTMEYCNILLQIVRDLEH